MGTFPNFLLFLLGVILAFHLGVLHATLDFDTLKKVLFSQSVSLDTKELPRREFKNARALCKAASCNKEATNYARSNQLLPSCASVVACTQCQDDVVAMLTRDICYVDKANEDVLVLAVASANPRTQIPYDEAHNLPLKWNLDESMHATNEGDKTSVKASYLPIELCAPDEKQINYLWENRITQQKLTKTKLFAEVGLRVSIRAVKPTRPQVHGLSTERKASIEVLIPKIYVKLEYNPPGTKNGQNFVGPAPACIKEKQVFELPEVPINADISGGDDATYFSMVNYFPVEISDSIKPQASNFKISIHCKNEKNCDLKHLVVCAQLLCGKPEQTTDLRATYLKFELANSGFVSTSDPYTALNVDNNIYKGEEKFGFVPDPPSTMLTGQSSKHSRRSARKYHRPSHASKFPPRVDPHKALEFYKKIKQATGTRNGQRRHSTSGVRYKSPKQLLEDLKQQAIAMGHAAQIHKAQWAGHPTTPPPYWHKVATQNSAKNKSSFSLKSSTPKQRAVVNKIDEKEKNKLSRKAIIGISLGSTSALVILVGAVFYYYRKNRASNYTRIE